MRGLAIKRHNKRLLMLIITAVIAAPTMGAIVFLLAQINGGDAQTQRLVFLMREGRGSESFWSVDPAHPEVQRHIHEVDGIPFEFDVSPDGKFIVYSMRPFDSQYEDLFLLDINSGDSTRLTDCGQSTADCSAPVIHPDGRWVAYQRIEVDPNGNIGNNRIWLLDMQDPAVAVPLMDDPQAYGRAPVWSPDGSRLAFYDPQAEGIVVYDYDTRNAPEGPTVQFILAGYGTTGTFSPDGTLLIYPEIFVLEQGPTRAYLQIADLERDLTLAFSDPGAGESDEFARWSPDGRYVAIGRVFAEGGAGQTQAYLWDTQTESVVPLVIDPQYNHSAMRWSPDSTYLALMRVPQANPLLEGGGTPQPEVWVYEMSSGELWQVAENARLPQWLP
jgi:Tol biopolymer transport system component